MFLNLIALMKVFYDMKSGLGFGFCRVCVCGWVSGVVTMVWGTGIGVGARVPSCTRIKNRIKSSFQILAKSFSLISYGEFGDIYEYCLGLTLCYLLSFVLFLPFFPLKPVVGLCEIL